MQIHNDILVVERNWGYFLQFTENEQTTVKLIYIKKGLATSYQYHKSRSEQWYVISGKILAIKGTISKILLPKQSIVLNRNETHRLEGLEDSIILEISKGYFSESDIVRL